VVANVLMGNSIGPGDGLSAAVERCSRRNPNSPHAFLHSLLSMLAVLSRELSYGEAQGTMIVAATPNGGGAWDQGWRDFLGEQKLWEPTVCAEVAGMNRTCGQEDFMAGGNRFQALTDIAGTVVGGGGGLCEVANTQDESLVHYYSEVLAMSFFLGPGPDGSQMLPVPMAFLGVRRYMGDVQGEISTGPPFFNLCGKIRAENWLNDDIQKAGTVDTTVDGLPVSMAASSFVAVASTSSAARGNCEVHEAVNNNCWNQRDHLDEDISLWYSAFAASRYGFAAQQAFRQIVRRIGTGPWGAGVWFGDSQQYFLAVWVATSLLGAVGLDYYVYDHFCENPGNQCFVLGGQWCSDCIDRAKVIGSPVRPDRCGQANIWDLIAKFKGRPVQDLYNALRNVDGPPQQVFDLLGQAGYAGGGWPTWTPRHWGPSPAASAAPADRTLGGSTRPLSKQPQAEQGNNYRWSLGVGTWGGLCTCPNGQIYEVGDNGDFCGSLACEYGQSGRCSSSGIQTKSHGMKVTCARLDTPVEPWAQVSAAAHEHLKENWYRRSSGAVGHWGGICECPDGTLYEVGDNNDNCASLACESGKAHECTAGGILKINAGMKVTCAPLEQ